MRFLTPDQCAKWCDQNEYPSPTSLFCGAGDGYARYDFRIPADAGQRVLLSRLLWDLADDDAVTERLLWLIGWSVWPAEEHMPLFKTRFGVPWERNASADVIGKWRPQLLGPGPWAFCLAYGPRPLALGLTEF